MVSYTGCALKLLKHWLPRNKESQKFQMEYPTFFTLLLFNAKNMGNFISNLKTVISNFLKSKILIRDNKGFIEPLNNIS